MRVFHSSLRLLALTAMLAATAPPAHAAAPAAVTAPPAPSIHLSIAAVPSIDLVQLVIAPEIGHELAGVAIAHQDVRLDQVPARAPAIADVIASIESSPQPRWATDSLAHTMQISAALSSSNWRASGSSSARGSRTLSRFVDPPR